MFQKKLLPKLAFGETKSLIQDNFNDLRDFFGEYSPSLKEMNSVVNKNKFLYKGIELNINGLSISSMATTPMYIEQFPTEEEMYVFIPLHGGCEINAFGMNLEAVALKKALFYTYMTKGTEKSDSSFVMFKLDKKRLQFTLETMLGNKDKSINFNFHIPQEINLQYGKVSFLDIFMELFKMIDNYNCNEQLLENIHFDDFIYRNIALMLRPNTLLHNENNSFSPSANGLKKIFEFIEHYPNEVLNLTDLEYISGLSARALQYLFQKELQTTPSKFLRTQKLNKAKEILQYNHNNLSISAIAYELGFSNQSQFSKYFKEEFGCLPSEIIKK